jgi:hypothetical protein
MKISGKMKTIPSTMPKMAHPSISDVMGSPGCGAMKACPNHPKVTETYTPDSMVVIVRSVPKTWSAISLKSGPPLSLFAIAVSSILNRLKCYNSFLLNSNRNKVREKNIQPVKT